MEGGLVQSTRFDREAADFERFFSSDRNDQSSPEKNVGGSRWAVGSGWRQATRKFALLLASDIGVRCWRFHGDEDPIRAFGNLCHASHV